MMPRMRRNQVLDGDAGVDLRRADMGMAQDRLHVPRGSSALQQMRRAGVAQEVRRDPPPEASRLAMLVDEGVERLHPQPATGNRRKEQRWLLIPTEKSRSRLAQVVSKGAQRRGPDRYDAVPTPLPLPDQHSPGAEVEVVQ